MSFKARLFKTATVERSSEGDDGFGGITKTEAEVSTGYEFHLFNITPVDREVLATRFGIVDFAVIMKGVGPWLSTMQNNDILQVSASEKYRILAISPMYGRGSTPHHVSLVIQAEVPD